MASARFATIEEAAEVLNIGRTAAYAEAKKWRVSDGADGIKVVAIGGSLRVPVVWLEQLADGPIDLDEVRAAIAARKATPNPAIDAGPKPPVLEVHTNPDRERAPASSRICTPKPAPQLDLFEPPSAS